MAYDRLYKLYDALKEQNATSVDREAFHKQMSAPGFEGYQNRLQLYKELKANGYVDYPNYETFSAELGMHAAAPAKGAQKHQQRQQTTPAKPQSAKPQPTKPQQGWTAAQRKQAEAQLEQNAYDNARLSRQWQQQSQNAKRMQQRAKHIGTDFTGDFRAKAEARMAGIATPEPNMIGSSNNAAKATGVVIGDDGRAYNQYETDDGSLTTNVGDVIRANETRNLRERLNRHGLDPENVTDDDIMKMYADEAYDAALRADKTANQQAVDEDAGRTPLETMRRAVANYDDLDDEYSDVEREVKRAQRINPDAMVAETLRRMPPSVLSRLRRQYGLYYEQHPKELKRGQNAQQAAEEAIKGSIYQHVYNKLVAANAPKSTLEYLMRKIADQPLYSQHIANQTAAGAITGNHAQYLADEQAMSAYENEHPVTGFFGTVGNMAADPTMYIGGWVGSMASKAVARGIGRAVVKGASEKMAERLAGRTLAGRIAQGVAAGAGNLGFYEGSHAALRQDRTGEHSIGDVLAATGRGVLLGAATGVAAPLIGNVADKVVARTASTGGKLAVRTGETATSVLAEGTIFAAPELIENARLADGDPNKRSGWSIWAGSLGTMAGFKGKHLIESAPRVLAELRTDGARRGVGFEGRLRNMLDRTPADLQMTNADLQELRDRGYGGLADLYAQVRPPKLPSTPPEFRTTPPPLKDYAQYAQPEELGKNKDKDLDGYSAMQRLMDDHSVSAAVRAKAYYLLTGKMLPMPSVLSYDRTANDDGTITITALGAENPIPAYGSGPKSKMQEMGADVVVRKTFKSAKEADVYEAKVRRQIELNTVDVGEQLREAQVQDDALDAAIDAVYPEGNHELLKNQYWSGRVKSIKDAIDKYLESQLTANSPHNPHTIRRGIEEEYGVDIDKALKKEPNRRTQAEVEAVQEYANELYNFGGREETVENAQVGGSGQAGVPPAAGATSEEAAKSTTENAAEQAHEEGKKAWTDNDGADDDTALQGAVDEKAARAHAALDRLNELFDEEAVSVIKEDPNAMLSSPALSEEHRAAIQEYIEAMAGLDGVKEAAQKAAEQNQAEVENEVVKSTNKETKLLMPATMKDDSGKLVSIYVVDGKLVLNTSGGIDTQKSAQTIVVYDPNTGKYRFVDPHDILELGLPVSPDTAVQSAIDAIQQRHNGIFDHAEQAARQQKSLPAPTAEGGEGPKPPRGRKMVVKCLRELSEAKKPIDKLNAIARILYTVKYGSEGIITPEEQALVDKTLAELKEEGYEIVDKWEGQPYDEGMKLSSDTEFKLVEGENIWGVQDGETKIVGLNKPEVWNMKEETTQYRIGPNGERIPYKTKGRRLQSAAAIVVTRDDTGWSVTARRLEEVKGRLERLKKGQAPTKVIEHLEKDVAGLERQLAEEKKQAAARDKLKSLFTNEEITAIRKDPYAMLDSPGLSEEHRAAIREYIEAYNIKRKEPEGEASATGEGMTGSESTPAPEEKQPIQMGSGALGSIPKNEKGEPVYEQAEPSTAWQAILEQTEGDTDMAAGVVDSMIADKEAAVKKAKKAKPKHADTIAGKIAAEKERKAAIERAKAELEAWKKIAAAKAGHEKAVAERKAAEAKQQEAEQQTVQGQPTEPKQEEQPKADDEDAAERAIAVETDWNDKIDDYIVEHYPHIDGTRARTPEEQKLYDAEREALKNDKTYKEMIAARDAAIEKTEETKQQEQERHEAAVDQAEQPTKPEKADKPVKAEPTEAKEGKQSTEAEGEKPDGQNDGADSEMPEAGEGEDAGKNPSLGDVISTLYGKGKDFASRIFNMKFFDFAKTPDFMKRLGITGSKFTIRYGVIARHFGKDGSHDFTQSEWEQLPNAIGHPFAITRLADKEKGFRIYTTFKTEKGEYVVVGVDVKNAGRDVEVNAISTLFGRRNGAHLSENEQVVYRSEIITPEQESLLSRPNSDQYPPERESSEGKDNASGADTQEGGGKSAVAVKEKPEEKPKKDDDDDGPDGPTAGGAATGGKGKPESDSESEEVKKLRKEYDEACDHLEDVMTEWDDKIIDYIAEHYPTQATVSAETRSPKGIKEREAMDNDPVLKKMREERNAAVKKADEERYKAFKRMDAAETGKGEQEPASPSAAAEQKKPAERKIEDVGEHIAGARKDALAELSQSVADVTLESLIELPASKAFKRPDLKRAVKEGVLREEDARFAEAVMAAYLGAAKPKLKEGYRRAKSEAAVRAWAEHAKEGVDLLAKLFSLDEKGRDKYMAEVRARKMYSEEEVRERQRQLEQWNPGKKFNGTCYPLNPVDVMARVMERLGYEAGAKVALPVVAAAPDSGFGYYVLTTRNGKTYYPGRWLTTIDDVVDEIVYAAKVENADPDTDHPAGKFSVKGVGEVLTEHTGKWTVITQRSLSARVEQHTFGSKEEAEAFAEKYKAGGKNRYASAPEEEVRAAGYTQYEIVYRHDSPTKGTGVYMPTGKMYGSLEEARAAIDGEHDELNGIVNAKLAEEKGKGGEGRKKDYVKIVLYTEDGRTWKYGVVLDDKYAPKKTSTGSMPFYLGDGFGTRKEAQAFVDKHREEWDAKIADIEKARRDFVYFKGTGERTGQDWRKGADVSAEQLMEQFGFRGVQFGNWTNQRDRQAAVNGAFDALMDLAQILGVSPRALSLNGELGLAFGSRGGGSAKAHYEPDEVVINLTKTQGAGSLAHEWWHALDNYFARHGNVKGGMVTESKGIAMRDELREAFNALIDSVAGSDYNIRSRQRGASYWGRPAEETARLFAAWVSDELQKRGLSSPFLSDTDPGAAERYAEMMYRLYKAMYESRKAETGGKAMTFEEFKKTPLALSGFVFPGTEELAAFGGHLRNIFNTVQEKVDGQTGKTLLYHRGPVVAEPNEAEQALLEAVNGVLKDTGIEVVTDTDEGQKVLDAANGNDVKLEASHRSGEAEERNKMWRLIDRATAMFTGKTEKEAREARRKEMQKITAERKEMYDRVLSGNFDEVTLRQIDNYIDNFSPYNNEWRPISKRLPQKALRGLRKGERASAVDVLFSRISESAVPKNERAGAEGKRRIEEKKKELLKKWAIATGNWHTSVSDFTDAKEPLGSGKDSDVYQSKDGKHVIKVSKGKDGLKKFRPDIDAVTLFNYIFPESRYEILGYGEVDGKFVKFLKQPVVDFTGSKPLSAEERVAYMADMGFKPVNKEKTAFSNGTIVVADLQGNNIVRDKSGNIRVIDADVKLHTKDFGGQYSYPPVEADTALPQANNGGNEKPRMQKVYHGSGADFDEFDNSHMGEGEGAQAYGWGTYVTEVEGIGRTYAKATARYDDNSSEEVLNRVESLAADLIKDRFGFRPGLSVSARGDNYDLEIPSDKKTLEQIKSYFDEYPYMWNAKVDRELSSFNLDDAASRREFANWVYEIVEPFAADAVGYAQKEETASRHLYTVEIPDDNGENYIDYNGRISDIPSQKIDAICTELEKLGWKRKDLPSMVRLTDGYGNIVLNPNAAGADLYEEIKVALKSQKLASELLSRAGFAGIKYPAEYMSGGRKDGAKNYVIFNEKDARITDHVRFFRTSGGEAYGFTVGGKIYVDPRIATADTPIHEYAHLWGDMMRRVNPKAWGDIVRLMKGKGGLWDWVKKNYPELETDDEVADEVLAQFSGKRGAERLREEMRKTAEGSGSITEKAKAISALQRVKEALGRFWRGVAELLHIRFTTAEEVADRVMADLLHGVDPRKVSNDNRYNEFAEKHKVDANEVKDYATAIKDGNLMAANRALSEIRRTLRVAHREMNLQEFGKFFRPINQELAERFGDIEKLRQEHIAAAEREHNAMEAARKKAEEEEAKKRKRQEELSMLTADEIDKRYAEALERGDEAAAREMLDEAARRNGYGDTESDYQGVGAWVAPSNPGYESDEARRADVEDNAPDVNLEDMALGYNLQPDDYFTHPERYSQDTPHGRESTQAIHAALEALKRGDKDVKVKVYRAVPTSVKEGSLRNGDWVTPSRKYAEMHGKSRLEGKYRIIEDEVPAKDLWWDGNDANEFGYDDGRGYKYKNTKNNRKLNDLVTRDDDGNIIPPSKRFNEREQDVRYSLRHVFGGNSGYVGYSMSKRAAQAREDGRYPKTDFRKEYSVTPKTFDALVDAGVIDSGEWHHTSMYGNKTPFYGWKPMYDAVYAANKKEVDKMARTLKMQQTEAEFSDYLDNDNPYRYRPTSEEYQKKMGDIDRQESHAARDINLMYDDAYNPETERKRMQELQSLREKSGKLKDEVRRQYPEDAAIEAENRKGVDWHVEQIEKRNKEREALRQKFHDYFDAKRDELVYDEMEKAGILTMGADGPHWSKPKYAEIFNHYKDAAIDTIAEAMAERLKNPYDEDYAEGISEYRKDLQKVKADKWAEGNALNAKYRDKEFRKQHPDYYKREKMLEEEKERLREKYEALEEDVLKRHPEELERRQKAFEWPSDEEAQQQAREKLLAERLQQFFEEDTADPDEGKKFRLLDDDDPQAQELSLPEGEPKETLAQAMVRRVKELAAKLGAKVRIVTSADDLPKTPGSRQRRMKGMYDTRTGEVTIVIGNHENLADVENTVLHEAVGHRGFRVLFDTKEKFDHAMDELYRVSGGKIRKWIDDKVRKLYDDEVDRIMERKRKERRARGEGPSEHHLEDMAAAAIEASKKKDQFRREATEEYGARLAGRIGEKGFEKLSAEEQTFWGRLKSMLQKALQRLAEGLNITGRHEWTDKDWAYVLHEAYKREKNGGKPSIFDEADTIAMRMRTGFGEGKEEGRKMTTLSGEEAKQALNEIFSAESHTVKPEKISSLAKFRDIFSKPIRTFLGEVIKVKDAVWNKVLRENRQNISGAILPTLQNADFAIRDTDGSILYVKRFLNSTGESTYNVAVVNKHGELEDYISSVHIKTNNNLLNKIGKGAELLIPENRNGYGHEVPSSSTPDAKIDIENESGNTFGSNKYKKSSDENPDEGMMFRDGDDDDIGDVDLGDAVDKMRDAAVESNANNLQAKREAMKAIGGNLSKLRQAMSRQKVYDKGTVKSVTDMAREMLQNGMLDKLSGYEAKRILSAAANVTGAENTARQINKLMDVMVDNQLRNAGDTFGKLLHSKGTRVNASGVEVQGKLDPDGAAIVDALKKGVQLDKEELNGRIGKALDKIGSEDKVIADQAANELAGLQLASRYVEDIKGSKAEETELRESLKEAKAQKDAGKMSAEAYKQYCEATEDAIRQNKIERADAYRQLIAQLGGVMGESAERAKAWREAEKQRVQDIQHNANSDMQGRPCNEHHKPSSLQKLCNSDLIRGLLMPLATFEQMLRMFGNKNVHGEGYLWNRFVRGWLRASENEYSGYRDALKELDDKVSEIFGKKMRWGDIFSLERKLPTMEVKFWDGGEMKPHTLTQGNLAYIYMVDKMSDGRMKLRAMGITEGDVEQIAKALDPKLKKLADWMQDEFLVQRRNKYNEVHKRMFGASMAAIENYFPLKILSGARTENVDVADDTGEPTMTSTTTGSIVKRRRNNLALDITNADAFSVILEHLQDMEHWAAYSEFNRDLNTLLSYRRFKNQVMNMSSAYGAGATLWKNFRNVCQLAAGSYRPPVATLDKTMVNLAKGVTAAKISFRIFTAIKQLLSFPAYLPDASARYLLQNLANPVGAWKWSIENLPLFHKRWNSRMAGDPRLLKTEMDWKMWRSRVVQMASKYGMSPNAFVDAVTVAMGAHAIYKTKLAKYLKQGYDKDKAEEKARQDAEIAYNQTQQSSEGAFLSTMQADRTWGSVLFTVFRNSAMSYTRQEYDALRNLARKLTTKGYKEKSIGFMAKQMVRDGLDENTAWRNAKRTYSRSIWREFVRVATFGYILQLAWNLGAYLPYLLLGDNDDDKKKMLEDAGLHALVGSVEGLTGGDVLSTAGQYALTGEGTIGNLKKEMPLTSDLHAIYQSFDYDAVQATNDVLNLLVQAGVGVNPQSLTDAVVGVMDYCENNPADARECALLIARIFNTPQSQLDKIYFDEIDLDGSDARKLSPKQIAERYAKYKLRRNTPLTAWMYGEDGRKERVAKYKKAANDVAKERLSALTDSRSGEDFTDWRNEYKQTSEGWGRINGLKDTDPDQYAAERKQIAGTPADTRYRIENRYKARINKLTDAWLKAKTPARRMKLADAMVALKKDEAKHLAAGK